MGRSSRIPVFYKLSLEQRVDETKEFATLTDDEVSTLRGTLSLQLADRMIERCGGNVVKDTCLGVAPVEELGFRNMATNSGKGAFYASSYCHLKVGFGCLKKCIDAAVKGRWCPQANSNRCLQLERLTS